MHTTTTIPLALGLLALTAPSIAAPNDYIIEERHIVVEKRQADVSQLLQLASLAGITALPTDPAVLLSLGPLANSLASALPTSSVLSVLVTAAPSGFVSSIVNDQSFANSFESAFAAGSSPSWFNALPTDVKSYLHTYTGFGQVAGAVGGIDAVATGGSTASGSGSGSTTTTGASGSGSGSSGAGSSTTGSGSQTSGSGTSTSGMMTTTSGSSGSGASATSSAKPGASSATSAGASSATSNAGPARPTAGVAAGIVGVFGLIGWAAAL